MSYNLKPPQAEKYSCRHRPGIALLLVLSILSLVVFIVSQTLEQTAVAVKLTENENAAFQMERLNFSLLRSVLYALETIGANKVHYALEQNVSRFAGIEIQINATDSQFSVSNLGVKSLDHYYFINRVNYSFTNDSVTTQLNLFGNLLSQKQTERKGFGDYTFGNRTFIGQLADWTDIDNQVINENFLIGQEIYLDDKPRFNTKNARLDLISELKMLPAFRDLTLYQEPLDLFNLPIRILPLPDNLLGCELGPLNLNMLAVDRNAVRQELEAYAQVAKGISAVACGYRELYNYQDRLTLGIIETIAENTGPAYEVPLNKDSKWIQLVNSIGVNNLNTLFNGLFSARSSLLEVRYTLSHQQLRHTYIYHLQLNYDSKKSGVPKKIEVKYFYVQK